MILVLVVTLAPASLRILAAARSRGPPRLRKIPAGAQAARPAETVGQGKWASETSKEQQSVEVRGVGGLLAAGDGCECSAGVWAGLGFEHCTAGWIEAFEEFLMATGVDGGGRLVLPSLPDFGSVVGVQWWCWRFGFLEGYPCRWFPSMCCQGMC